MSEVPASPRPDPDLLLVRSMALGNRQALTELYNRHGRGILSYLIGQLDDRQLAEEVLQDVMLAAWHGAASFREESKVRTWLLAISRRKVLNVWRKRKVISVPLDDELIGEDEGVLSLIVQADDRSTIKAALRELTDDQREILELIFYHDMSGVEAAEVMGVSPGTVKSRLHRAKSRLRGLLKRKEVGDGW